MRDFPNGTSQFVALDEIRAGIDPIDPRGTWALGMAGASITVRDGIFNLGNSSPPNSQSVAADDIVGCSALIAKYGLTRMQQLGMPCQTNTPEANHQATSRSMHPAGVHVLLLDGSAQFVSENVFPEAWQDLHSRTASGFEAPFGD